MLNLSMLEEHFKKYIKDLNYWIPESVYELNLELLQRFNLLHFKYPQKEGPVITKHFHLAESSEKITLYNDEFIVWIQPDRTQTIPATYVLIAMIQDEHPKLEAAYIASGVYNSSVIVLRVLEKFLLEIHENEQLLGKLKT